MQSNRDAVAESAAGENLEIRSAGITDVGLKRDGNEDAFSIDDSLRLFIVADGMGGHLAGEVASRVAVEMINKSYRRWSEKETPEEELFAPPDGSISAKGNYIRSSILLANRVIYEMALEHQKYHGMGTTVVVLHVSRELVVAANVGDSRIYLVRNGRIERLSKDHTIVSEQVEMGMMSEEEASASPLKHILTRNLGSSEETEPEVFELLPSVDDRFILCSDGLTDLVGDEELLGMARKAAGPDELCRELMDLVLRRGAHDNTTIACVFIGGMGRMKKGPLTRIGLTLASLFVGIQRVLKK